jgi:XTP/dITP diphosphohydrolase
VTRFVLATANPDKAEEIAAILADECPGAEFVPRPEGIADIVEDGDTLEANARLKAIALCDATGLPAVADDTGLEVDALGGAPGVHSARYAGARATYAQNCAKLLEALDGVPPDERAARFVTVAVAVWPDGREVTARGSVEGWIAQSPRGDRGFGYDPVFVPVDPGVRPPDGRTFAEMDADEKHARSHRGLAFRALAKALRDSLEVDAR